MAPIPRQTRTAEHPASELPPGAAPEHSPLIVHSHLRWDFVWQRPQQILSRMAATAPVLFVEEPVFVAHASSARFEISSLHAGVTRAVPMLPARHSSEPDEGLAEVRRLLRRCLAPGGPLTGSFADPMHWFYTPMPAPAMLGAVGACGVVYDCMDELSKFRFAPADLPRRERLLLASADVVFTGGHSLFRAKRQQHGNVHVLGCGVDAAHFGRARSSSTPVPHDVAALSGPIFGYVGVIDERLDYALLAALATSRPDASLVMVGPAVKVSPDALPQAPNIHWLGQRPYDALPGYMKAFDVCLMPFAMNEATEYINPTKTLEYMAAGKPIVSTPVADVVHHFTPIVAVARTPEAFVEAVSRAAAHPNSTLVAQGIARARSATWDAIVAEMGRLVRDAVGARASAA